MRGVAFLDRVRGGASDGSALDKLEAGLRVRPCSWPTRRLSPDPVREGHAWGLDPVTENTRAHWRAGVSHVAAVLRQGMEEGVFYEGDPELLAASVTAVMQVQLAGRLFRAGNQPDAEEIASGTLTLLRRMLCVDPRRTRAAHLAAAS